jgi:hypothetical protein
MAAMTATARLSPYWIARPDPLISFGVVEAPLCNQKTLWSPWHNPYLERLIGSVRRECLDHVIVLHERHLKQLLTQYMIYYHR